MKLLRHILAISPLLMGCARPLCLRQLAFKPAGPGWLASPTRRPAKGESLAQSHLKAGSTAVSNSKNKVHPSSWSAPKTVHDDIGIAVERTANKSAHVYIGARQHRKHISSNSKHSQGSKAPPCTEAKTASAAATSGLTQGPSHTMAAARAGERTTRGTRPERAGSPWALRPL